MALKRYARQGDLIFRSPASSHFFLSEQGTALIACVVRSWLCKISRVCGLRKKIPGHRCGRGPRLQDLRHTFATKRLVECLPLRPPDAPPVVIGWVGIPCFSAHQRHFHCGNRFEDSPPACTTFINASVHNGFVNPTQPSHFEVTLAGNVVLVSGRIFVAFGPRHVARRCV